MTTVIHIPGFPKILVPGRNYPITSANLLREAASAPAQATVITPPIRKILREIGITTPDSFVKSAN